VDAARRSYLLAVVGARGLAFLRLFLVANILGDAGRREFGTYQPALELINWLVPLAMLGLADVAERYGKLLQSQNRLMQTMRTHVLRIFLIGSALGALLIAAGPWVVKFVWGGEVKSVGIVVACAGTMVMLALYQYVMALLRGLGRYSQVALCEVLGAVGLLLFSCGGAYIGTASAMVWGYLLSVVLPSGVGFVALRTTQHSRRTVTVNAAPQFGHFAVWTLLRLLLTMTFGFLAVWGVNHIAKNAPSTISVASSAMDQSADFGLPLRIAQLLGFLAVTVWASAYGTAAAAWSHGRRKRAELSLLRLGIRACAALLVMANIALWLRPVLMPLVPNSYHAALEYLLPPLLATFLWYGFLTLFAVLADLRETPQRGVYLWASAVVIQLALILSAHLWTNAPKGSSMAMVGAMSISVLIVAPLLLWKPARLTKQGLALAILALCPLAFLVESWAVNSLAGIITVAALAMVYSIGGFGTRKKHAPHQPPQ